MAALTEATLALDARVGLTNVGTGGSALNATATSVTTLAHDGTSYCYLPGVTGNYVAVVDPPNGALDITGDIDIRVKVALDDWTPAADVGLIAKYGVAGTRSWYLFVRPTGVIRLIWSADGTNTIVATSTVAPSVVDGASVWLRVTLDVDNGASGNDVTFYTSGSDDGMTWTQLGTTVTTAGVTSIFNSSSPVEVGSRQGGTTDPAAAKFYRTVIYAGLTETDKRLDIDFTTGITDGGQVSVPFTGTAAADLNAAGYISNLGTGGNLLPARVGSNAAAADSNDPLWLGHDGTNYLYLPGVAGNLASSPSSSALNAISTDIDIRIRVAPDDWTPAAANQTLISKDNTSPDRQFLLLLLTSGALYFAVSTNGTAMTQDATSSVAVGGVDGQPLWLRVTLDADNGSSNSEFKFWTAPDSPTMPTSWTQLGTTRTSTVVSGIYASAARLEIGAFFSGLSTLAAGKFYRAQVRNGINGTVVFDADFTTGITSGATTSFTESSSNAATVTINRSTTGRKAVAVVRDCWLLGTDDYFRVEHHPLLDMDATQNFSVVGVYRMWANATDGGGIINKRENTATTGWSLATGGTSSVSSRIDVSSGASRRIGGSQTITLGSTTVHVGLVNRDNATVYTNINGVAGSTSSISGYGTFSNSRPMFVGFLDGNAVYSTMELYGAAVFRRLLTAAEITTINNYYQSGTNPTAARALLAEAVWWIDAELSKPEAAINRSTSGKKSVAVTRPTWLLGTNAYLEVADNDLLDFGASDSFTVLAAVRQWATSASQVIVGKSGNPASTSMVGYTLYNNGTPASSNRYGDGTNRQLVSDGLAITLGSLQTRAMVRNTATDSHVSYVNGTAGTSGTDTTTGSLANALPLMVGRVSDSASGYADAEVYAVAIWRRALSAAEIAAMSTALLTALPEPPNTTTLVNETTDRTVALVGGDRNLTLHTLPKGLVLDS